MSAKRKHTDLPTVTKRRKAVTLESKLHILKDFDSGMKICQIAEKLDFPHSTVRTIIKDKRRILEALKNSHSLSSRVIRKRHGIKDEMEKLLKAWCENQMRVYNCAVDQISVCMEARLIFARLKEQAGDAAKSEKFSATNGWYYNFKKRCNWHSVKGPGQGYPLWTSSENLSSQTTYTPEPYDLRLVTEVEKNPMLYDPSDPDYRNKELSTSKWNEIWELLGITAERGRARWSSLKACYSRSLTLSHNFYLSEPMSFLQPHLNINKTPSQESFVDEAIIDIKSEPELEGDNFSAEMSGEILISPINKTCSRAAESTTADALDGNEDLEMHVEEIHEYPSTTTSFPYIVSRNSPSTSSQQQMSGLKHDGANPGQKLTTKKGANPTASGVKENTRGDNSMSSTEAQTSDTDMEYFKGFSSLIKQLSVKRKRQLFGTFAAELFRHLDEQEND